MKAQINFLAFQFILLTQHKAIMTFFSKKKKSTSIFAQEYSFSMMLVGNAAAYSYLWKHIHQEFLTLYLYFLY